MGSRGEHAGGQYSMRSDVRALFRASLTTASQFPVRALRPKLRQNMREMFLAHRNVAKADEIACLVQNGWRDLRTFQSIAAQDDTFFELISRKSKKSS